MATDLPFVRFTAPDHYRETNALFGFALSPLEEMLASSQQNERTSIQKKLERQVQLINALWNSGIIAFDLRFMHSGYRSIDKIGLLCRIRYPVGVDINQFYQHCLEHAMHLQTLFKDIDYALHPLVDEASFSQYVAPFPIERVAEVRRYEEIFAFEDTYNSYETYVTYPWTWTIQNHTNLFQQLQGQRNDCLVSVYLEPTRLNAAEEALLLHASSSQVKSTLLQCGPQGKVIFGIYKSLVGTLRRPYLLHIRVAGSQQAVEQIGRAYVTMLSDVRGTRSNAVLQYPRTQYEMQCLSNSLVSVDSVLWGSLSRQSASGTERLRYLMDSRDASMAFRIPIASPTKKNTSRESDVVPQIRVLLAYANPAGESYGSAGRVERAIREAIQLSRYRDKIIVTPHHATTIHDFRRALYSDKFQFIQFTGYGREDGLFFEDELGRKKLVPSNAFAELLLEYNRDLKKVYNSSLNCIILNASSLLEALGKRISIGSSIRSIITDGIEQKDAVIEFSRGFYDILGNGQSIDRAYREGRQTVDLAAPRASFFSKIF